MQERCNALGRPILTSASTMIDSAIPCTSEDPSVSPGKTWKHVTDSTIAATNKPGARNEASAAEEPSPEAEAEAEAETGRFAFPASFDPLEPFEPAFACITQFRPSSRNPPAVPVYWNPMNESLNTTDEDTRRGVSSFALKIVAIVGMTANHASYMFYPYLPAEAFCLLFGLGGLAFPIMAFLLVEGYRRTSSVPKYARRLLVFALISQIPYGLFLAGNLNVLFTLLIGLAVLHLYDRLENRAGFWAIAAALTAASSLCDWGILGPIMVLMMRVLEDRRQRVVYPLLLPILADGIPALARYLANSNLVLLSFALYPLAGCTATIPLLLSYNGKRGLPMKWFFYAYYPLHILVLGLAKGLLLNDWTWGM